jgi:hypothetical protein
MKEETQEGEDEGVDFPVEKSGEDVDEKEEEEEIMDVDLSSTTHPDESKQDLTVGIERVE